MIEVGSDFSGVEIWKNIKEYEELYQVSNLGRVKSLSRKVTRGGITGFTKNRILKSQVRSGYHKVSLCKKAMIKQISVHRLVACAFVDNKENKKEVNHINGVKTDNNKSNLEWCTRKENALHSYRTGLQKKQKGSSHGNAKLNEDKVIEIRKLSKQGLSLFELENNFNVAKSTLSQIINKQRWKHI